ncbi:hypothetical protein ASG89_25235 [Paenibacillus sp. Soil766]|uniref:hypothetical protein n=1 Tax=Paenibacillus sp. Soil766 TaxID=1736404 RepID=UPI00070D0FEB|nr:hypothetical protein [Paenibacillus sp. Soil766]KRF01671.1 hypothetical protein ASG89_25235 [Paenibacillus sp. Soil766]
MTKKTSKLITIKKMQNFIKEHRTELFQKEIEDTNFLIFFQTLNDMPIEDIERRIRKLPDELEEDGEDLTLTDLLDRNIENIKVDHEIKKVIESKLYIWDVSPNKIAHIFHQIGLELEKAVEKIQSYCISERYSAPPAIELSTGRISYREHSIDVYQFNKEIKKRDSFLQELREEFIKLK